MTHSDRTSDTALWEKGVRRFLDQFLIPQADRSEQQHELRTKLQFDYRALSNRCCQNK